MGECQPSGEIQPENLLRGKFRLSCERGFVDVVFTLAPTMPPKLQSFSFGATKSLDANMKTAAESLHFHGGYGYTLEYDIQLFFRRAKQLQISWYDDRVLEELIAASVLD